MKDPRVKTIVCDKVVCERWCVAKKDHVCVCDRVVWERWCVFVRAAAVRTFFFCASAPMSSV